MALKVLFTIVTWTPLLPWYAAKLMGPWNDPDGAGAEGLEWEVPSPAPFHTFETPPNLNAAATKIVT